MSSPVSIILPALDTPELLETNLPPIFEELERRDVGDEVIVVDDTGTGALNPWLQERFENVRVVVRERNGGFAKALLSGVEAAGRPLIFSMNTDVRVRPGFLGPLVDVLADENVLAVSPRVLLDGAEDSFESNTTLGLERGLLRLEHREPDTPRAEEVGDNVRSVPFAVGGTMLFRRAEFLERGGFDALFEPFYLEDVDWCWEAWTVGRRVLVQPASIVEHNHRGTIGNRVDREVVRAAIERNRMLFLWKHLDDTELLNEHLNALAGRAANAWLREERDPLIWTLLALEERQAALAARAGRPPSARGFTDVLKLVAE